MTDDTETHGAAPTKDTGDRPLRVVLADDQDLVRAGFRVILSSDDGIEVVGEAGDGWEAVNVHAMGAGSGRAGGRPRRTPLARTAARPSRVPSVMSSRMNSGQHGEDVEDQAAAWGGGVEVLVRRGESDPAATQLADQGQQVGEAAAEAGELQDDEVSPSRR